MIPDLKPLGDFIAQVGAPVAMVFFLLYQMFAMDKRNRDVLEKQNQALAAIAQALDILLHKEGLK